MNAVRLRLEFAKRELDAAIALLTEGTRILPVPYLSQWGPTANVRRGDCGPACVAMLAHYRTGQRPTVDQAANACGQPSSGDGQNYTDHRQLRQGASLYGFTLQSRSRYIPPPLDLALLQTKINDDKPSIVLLHYGVLRDKTNGVEGVIKNQDQTYGRGHWCPFIGYDENGVYIHDPDFWGARISDGDRRFIPEKAFTAALAAVAPGCTVANQGLVIPSQT